MEFFTKLCYSYKYPSRQRGLFIYKILIIEDDTTIAYLIKDHLLRWDYEAECVQDFKNITEQVLNYKPHLILLDIMLPYFNGFHWCGEIRKVSKIPIMFVSSIAIFMIVFSLYSLPAEAVIYASVICVFAFCVTGIIRFIPYYKRHQTLDAGFICVLSSACCRGNSYRRRIQNDNPAACAFEPYK